MFRGMFVQVFRGFKVQMFRCIKVSLFRGFKVSLFRGFKVGMTGGPVRLKVQKNPTSFLNSAFENLDFRFYKTSEKPDSNYAFCFLVYDCVECLIRDCLGVSLSAREVVNETPRISQLNDLFRKSSQFTP